MTYEHVSPQTHDREDYPWVVEFLLRCDDHQRRIVDNLGTASVHSVIRLWLEVITPRSMVFEPHDVPIQQVAFETRDDARHFIKTWGGRLTTNWTAKILLNRMRER